MSNRKRNSSEIENSDSKPLVIDLTNDASVNGTPEKRAKVLVIDDSPAPAPAIAQEEVFLKHALYLNLPNIILGASVRNLP